MVYSGAHRARAMGSRDGALNAAIFLRFLQRLVQGAERKLFVINDVSQALARQNIPRDKATRKPQLCSHMRGLQRRPAKLRAFFQAPTLRYAA
jgi:hypothetical protein